MYADICAQFRCCHRDASNGDVDGQIDRAEWLCYNLLKGEYGISKGEQRLYSPHPLLFLVNSRTLVGFTDGVHDGAHPISSPHQCPLGSVAGYLCHFVVLTFAHSDNSSYIISKGELDQINKRFDDLDTNKSGRLTPKELGISLAAPANTPA